MDTAPILYVNSVQIAQSQYDLRLTVGSLDVADETRIVTRVSAIVYMTFQHTKILAELLTNTSRNTKPLMDRSCFTRPPGGESTEAKAGG